MLPGSAAGNGSAPQLFQISWKKKRQYGYVIAHSGAKKVLPLNRKQPSSG